MQNILKLIGAVVLIIISFKVLLFVVHIMGWMLGIVGAILWVCALIHILFNEMMDTGAKVIWFFIVLFTYVIGAIVYFLFGRRASAAI